MGFHPMRQPMPRMKLASATTTAVNTNGPDLKVWPDRLIKLPRSRMFRAGKRYIKPATIESTPMMVTRRGLLFISPFNDIAYDLGEHPLDYVMDELSAQGLVSSSRDSFE